MRAHDDVWKPRALTCSGLDGSGLSELWDTTQEHRRTLESAGLFGQRRARQDVRWFERLVNAGVQRWIAQSSGTKDLLDGIRTDVERGLTSPTAAAQRVLDELQSAGSGNTA